MDRRGDSERGNGAKLLDAGERLGDMAHLQAEIARRRLPAVLGDLRAAQRLAGEAERDDLARRLAALVRVLEAEADALQGWDPARDPGFFLQQVRNRAFELDLPDLQREAESRLDDQGLFHLRERIKTGRAAPTLVRSLAGHGRDVGGVAVTRDGKRAATGSLDGLVKLWDLETGEAVRTFQGHSDGVRSVALTPDERLLVSASVDRTLRVWDIATGRLVWTLSGHRAGVWSVAVSRDGACAVSTSLDATLAVWDLETGKHLRTLAGHRDPVMGVAIHPDGRRVLSASMDGSVKVWALATGEEIRSLRGHEGGVWSVAVNRDGRWALSASADRTLRVWDLDSYQGGLSLAGHTRDVVAVTWTGFERAISGSLDGSLVVWDVERGREIATLDGHTGGVIAVSVSPDGLRAVSGSKDTTAKVWDLAGVFKASPRDRAAPVLPGLTASKAGLHHVAVSVTGAWAGAVAGDGSLHVWDLAEGRVRRSFRGYADAEPGKKEIREVRISEDGRALVTSSYDGTVALWDVASGDLYRELACATTAWRVGISGDARWAVGTARGGALVVWNLETGEIERTLDEIPGDVQDIRVSADGTRAVMHRWHGPSMVWDIPLRRRTGTFQTGCGIDAISGDGRRAVAPIPSYDVTPVVEVWNLDGPSPVRRLPVRRPLSMSWDGRLGAWLDGGLVVADLTTGRHLVTLKTTVPLSCTAFAPDGRTIVAGDMAGAIHLLDFAPG